ncbi:uncharacterized protein LOC128955983 [Oppia nitens]|uniref:uncharacterized protein LOC128955983 n=1 Tax=Oppia nitens TaxID=1686743 RepID=UPI0023DCC0E9|nr:uncharacterized protein LOC128955983 [Oppia nitens]
MATVITIIVTSRARLDELDSHDDKERVKSEVAIIVTMGTISAIISTCGVFVVIREHYYLTLVYTLIIVVDVFNMLGASIKGHPAFWGVVALNTLIAYLAYEYSRAIRQRNRYRLSIDTANVATEQTDVTNIGYPAPGYPEFASQHPANQLLINHVVNPAYVDTGVYHDDSVPLRHQTTGASSSGYGAI